jgi:hypothetical protein
MRKPVRILLAIVAFAAVVAIAGNLSAWYDVALAIVALIAYNARKGYVESGRAAAPPTCVCARCQSQVTPQDAMPGSFGLEVFLWLFFIIPGVIYSSWRHSSRKRLCPVCGEQNPVPLDTPLGQQLAMSR